VTVAKAVTTALSFVMVKGPVYLVEFVVGTVPLRV